MRVSRFSRRFHDPWGNKNGNQIGSIIRRQYRVGQADLSGDIEGISSVRGRIDAVHMYESTGGRFIRGAKNSVERLRR